MLAKVREWLGNTNNTDSIDRRNAAFFQLFLLYFGVGVYADQPEKYLDAQVQQDYLAHVYGAILPWPRVGMFIDFGTDFLMAAVCVVSFCLTRQGRFRLAVKLFLGALLGGLTLNYAAFGSTLGTHYMNLVMIISALMLGRRALWIVFSVNVLNSAVGQAADTFGHYYHTGKFAFDYHGVAMTALNQFIVAVILDQTIKALRDALADSNRRRDLLAAEIVEREKTQQQLVHLEKMRVIGQLASGTAHDFNNVLGIILGFARERRRPGVGSPETEREIALSDALEGVDIAARRGASISRKLLDFSRADTTLSEVFDATEALNEVRPMLRQLLPDSVTLSLQIPSEPTMICFDRGQLELALLNIAANARDAMPNGGSCQIVLTQDDNAWVTLSIRDSGEGMSEQTRQRVLEPFFTTKPAGIGTGLGLSVVHGLMERSGGRLSIESALGQGTAVTLYLPLTDRNQTAQSAFEDNNGIRVFLIDDDDVLRNLLTATLEDYGYLVSAAHDGRSAMQLAGDMREPPDVIVCDHYMPDTDGTTLMRHLRERFPGAPAILISANAPINDESEAPHAYTNRLPKPFSPDRLASRIREVVDQAR